MKVCPAQSLDLNPTEHLWDEHWTASHVYHPIITDLPH